MEIVTQHLQEHWRIYVFAVILLVPILVVFRRWLMPIIQYAVEVAIYLAIVHVVLGGVVRLAGWFKDQSTMKRARGLLNENFDPGWTTPIPKFWEYDSYNPRWLLYMEILLAIGIIILVWRYRPMLVQRKKKKPVPAKKRPGMQYFSNGRTGGTK